MKTYDLTGSDWSLIYVKNDRYLADGAEEDVALLRRRGYEEIPACVPGNLELDLMRAGRLDDPFYADNAYDRQCEYLHAFYLKEFDCPEELSDPVFVFDGIDTIADISLNGVPIGRTENMLIPHEIPAKGALKVGRNRLVVHIIPAVIEARKYPLAAADAALPYNYAGLYLRRAMHTYGWDIMPRIVSAGIWRPVRLIDRKSDRIAEFYACTMGLSPDHRAAQLHFLYNTVLSADEADRYTLKISGECKDSRFETEARLWHSSGRVKFTLHNPRLWWPKNAGEPELYSIRATLYLDGRAVDEHICRLGVRMIDLIRSSTTNDKGEGEFLLKVNGKPIFCMGTNWVPVDALHSRDAERIPKILPMLSDTKCNIIRIWGGSVYEDDQLYDYCDENGIMVWQDFMMACAIYPQTEDFLARMKEEAEVIVKRLRQHPAIVLWSGDNENDIAYAEWFGIPRDPNRNRLTREVIPNILFIHDPTRPYLPSSPYYDETAYRTHAPTPEYHVWGPRDYFKSEYYRTDPAHFASEIGYHGCPSPASLKEYIPPEYLWTVKDSDGWRGIEDNRMWIAHASSMENDPKAEYFYRIRLMANQVTYLFGNSVPCTLSDFAKASQISQAEAKKFFIERYRIGKWRRTGIIWWNLMDGCPQISDAVVSYDFRKKLAYHYIRRSQEPICLMFDEPDESGERLRLFAVCDLPRDAEISYRVTDLTAKKIVAEGECTAKADRSLPIDEVVIGKEDKHFFFIEWTSDGEKHTNHYFSNVKAIDYPEYLAYLGECGYDEFEGF